MCKQILNKLVKNCDVIHIHITCSVSLQSGIANYWPGMHNTGFFRRFLRSDPCERGFILTRLILKGKGKNFSIFVVV